MFKALFNNLHRFSIICRHKIHTNHEFIIQKYLKTKIPDKNLEKQLSSIKSAIREQENLLQNCLLKNTAQDQISKLKDDLESNKLKFYNEIKQLIRKENQEKLNKTLKTRFFYDQSFSIYSDTPGGFYDLGPVGSALQTNLINEWRKFFILQENIYEIDCALITPEKVLKASGHVAKFNDFMVRDTLTNEAFRVDHLIKAEVEKRINEDKTLSSDESERMKKMCLSIETSQATGEEIQAFIHEFNVKSPTSGNKLGSVQPFNLMFQTSVGPSSTNRSYLRPETAQGVYVNFNNLYRFNQKKLPIVVAQIGKSFRNEINPKSGLIRQREFLMAEIEHFFDPNDKEKDLSKFHAIKNSRLPLLPIETQINDTNIHSKMLTISEAFDKGFIKNQIVAHYLWKINEFCTKICGINKDKMRFRQHLKNEMAHYAEDCWDLECLTEAYGWIECVGIADRSCYDLAQHSKHAGVKITAERKLMTSILVDKIQLKLKHNEIERLFKINSKTIIQYLEQMSESDLAYKIEPQLNHSDKVRIELNEQTFDLPSRFLEIKRTKKSVNVEEFTPGIIEPSFGISRLMYTILEHNFCVRDDDPQKTYFTIPIEMSPFKCSILPILTSDVAMIKFSPIVSRLSHELSSLRIVHKIDDASGSIGRRYARSDEIAIPFVITIDFDSIKEPFMVSLRERDSCEQVVVKMDEICLLLNDLNQRKIDWHEVIQKYPKREVNESV